MLKIDSLQGDAEIYINGKARGSTASKKGESFSVELSEGKYTIQAKKKAKQDGYDGTYNVTKEVFVKADTTQTITLNFILSKFELTEEGKKLKFAKDERARQKLIKDYNLTAKEIELIRITDSYRSSSKRLKDFVSKSNGVILDKRTGLEWMRCSLGQSWDGSTCKGKAKEYTWKEAKKACESKSWRLPNIWELETLVYCSSGQDKGRFKGGDLNVCSGKYKSPTISQKAFPNTKGFYWSSSLYKKNKLEFYRVNHSYSWLMFFNLGRDGWGGRPGHYLIRCVRDGK